MTDGRVYTLEDEIDVIHEDLGAARRRVADIERAMVDGRMVNEPEHDQALWRARRRVVELERELSRLAAVPASTGQDEETDMSAQPNAYRFDGKLIHVGTPGIFHKPGDSFVTVTKCGRDATDCRATAHTLADYQPCVVCFEGWDMMLWGEHDNEETAA